jgi:nucleotide-binding universal stress UspA family protein
MKGYRKVLIAVNGSIEVLEEGLRIARDEGCWVTIVKVIPPNEGDLHLTGVRDIEDILMGGALSSISKIREIARAERTLLKTRIEEGSPKSHKTFWGNSVGSIGEKIIEVAEEEQCDLIILGSQKRKGIRRLFGDNVLKKVIDNSPCPVLVVAKG